MKGGHSLISATNEANGVNQDKYYKEYCDKRIVLQDLFIGNYGISQKFGNVLYINKVNVYKQYGWKGHNGVDFSCPTGTKLISCVNGVVTTAYNNVGGWGYHCYVWDKDQKIMVIYAHMKSLNVKVSDKVKVGNLLGLSDNTGNSTGAHLHFGAYKVDDNGNKINLGNGYGGSINPFDSNVFEWIVTNPKTPTN